MKTATRVAESAARRGGIRRSVAVALVACGAALMIAPTVGAVEGVDGEEVDHITIVQTPAEVQGECKPAAEALSYNYRSTNEVFELTVTASSPLCDPVEPTAVIYGMPGNGQAWPQQLLESETFTIAEAGVTVITFTKDCIPAQFDVINGVTPQTINGPWEHGPLLFPLDPNSAEQYWGCATTTTTSTTTSTTTTSTTASTTTTVPADVAGTTTIAPGVGGASTSTVPPQQAAVAGTSQNRANAAALALTGSRTTPMVATGAVLVALGAAMFLVARRRRTEV